jgi:hypothetical protein
MNQILLLITSFTFALSADTADKKPQLYSFPLNKIRAGQLGVGGHYAVFKALQKAKLSPQLEICQLSPQEKQQLLLSLEDELSEGIPVFIAPNGNVHSIDQHHDMFVLSKLVNSSFKVPIDIQRDFRKESLTKLEFKNVIQNNGWVYTKYLDTVLDEPLYIRELTDIPERSVTGMCFMHFDDNEKIPFKGKHFVPFIQFLLVDFLKDNGLMNFQSTYQYSDVESCVELVKNSSAVKQFLRGKLLTTAPKELKDFLK